MVTGLEAGYYRDVSRIEVHLRDLVQETSRLATAGERVADALERIARQGGR